MLEAADRGGARFFIDEGLRRQGVLAAFSIRTAAARGGDKYETNRAFLSNAWQLDPGSLTFADQVHGSRVALVPTGDRGETPVRETDAIVTATRNAPLVILTADCVPILLADPAAGVVGAAHAGWRGTLAGIAGITVTAMVEAGADAARIQARLGPSIGPCCYRVDDRLKNAFSARFGPQGEGDTLDLASVNISTLTEAGVPDGNIEALRLCTSCRDDLFFSWRRSRDTGRMAALAMLL